MVHEDNYESSSIFWVEVNKIHPNPYQPRRDFDEARLQELADSIRQYGVLQPLVVTRKETQKEDGGLVVEYELIAGERRLRASKLASVSQVPVIIRSGAESDRMKLELAIIENLQREDLNPVDRARAFKQLAEEFSLSHSQVAKKVGRSREYVSNTLRLLNLPEAILQSIQTGALTEGHGRSLLMLNDRPEEMDVLYREVLLKKLSVREVERITRKIAVDKVRKKDWGFDQELIDIERQLTESLGTRVQIARTEFGGKVTIDYFSSEDLHKLLTLVSEERASQGVRPLAPSVEGVPPEMPETAGEYVEPKSPEQRLEQSLEQTLEEPPTQSHQTPVPTVESPVDPSSPHTPEESPVEDSATAVDDRSTEERRNDDDTDLYAVKNFSL